MLRKFWLEELLGKGYVLCCGNPCLLPFPLGSLASESTSLVWLVFRPWTSWAGCPLTSGDKICTWLLRWNTLSIQAHFVSDYAKSYLWRISDVPCSDIDARKILRHVGSSYVSTRKLDFAGKFAPLQEAAASACPKLYSLQMSQYPISYDLGATSSLGYVLEMYRWSV